MKFATILTMLLVVNSAVVSGAIFSGQTVEQNVQPVPMIQRVSTQYIDITSSRWSYETEGFEYQLSRPDASPCKAVISSLPIPQNSYVSSGSGNFTTFEFNSESLVCTITVSSAQPISIANLSYWQSLYVINPIQAAVGGVTGYYVLNDTGIYSFNAFSSLQLEQSDKFRYLKIGHFIRDHRRTTLLEGRIGGAHGKFINDTLPPGNWSFIFYSVQYDVPNSNSYLTTRLVLNISDAPDDLKVVKNDNGTVNALWYGELNPLVLASKNDVLEVMLRGQVTFQVNHTFISAMLFHPRSNGFWTIHWTTPSGVKKCGILNRQGRAWYLRSQQQEVFDCLYGYGGPGTYQLRTTYYDKEVTSGDDHDQSAEPLYLTLLDVPVR